MTARKRRTASPSGRQKYSFVECDEHPGLQPSYIVCTHAARAGALPLRVLRATDQEVGEIPCDAERHGVDQLLLMCARHREVYPRAIQ